MGKPFWLKSWIYVHRGGLALVMAASKNLSPRLACLCADDDEIRRAILDANLLTTQDLGSLASDAHIAADRLKLEGQARIAFANIFAITKARGVIGHLKERRRRSLRNQ